MRLLFLSLCIAFFLPKAVSAQQLDLSGFEISVDQDRFTDFLRDTILEDKNHVIGLRVGFYGSYANSYYLGLPWVRETVDALWLDELIYNRGVDVETISHNFTFTVNGFSPRLISDETDLFDAALAGGYDLAQDRPFSSFTGFRSTRRLEGSKLFAHSAYRLDMAITTSFTFGFMSLGLAQGVENLFGGNRPSAVLWDRDENETYPTGQAFRAGLPVFLYSFSYEAVVLRPLRKIVIQARPEFNLGYYTDVGFGIDVGKVMNVEKNVDNLGYTDTNNPSVLKVNNENISFAFSIGGTLRAVLYNAHLNALFNDRTHHIAFADTRKIVLEGYIGAKVQILKKIEFSMSINQRTSQFSLEERDARFWGTLGLKYLLAPEGEGCYDL